MRYVLTILSLYLCNIAFATNYFVKNAGNDSNNGLSDATAWKTIQKVNTIAYRPGDTIFFKRGDLWDLNNEISWLEGIKPSTSGTASAYIVYTAYGDTTLPLPRVRDRDIIPGWNVSSNWTSVGTNIWRMKVNDLLYPGTWKTSRIWIDSLDARPAKPGDSLLVNADRVWTSGDSLLYIYSTTNPATAFWSMRKTHRGGQSHYGFTVSKLKYIKVSYLDIGITSGLSFRFIGDTASIMEHCIAGWDGVRSPVYIQSSPSTGLSVGGIIRDCTIDPNYKIFNPFYIDEDGDGIAISDGSLNWQIYNNYITDLGHSAIGIDNSNPGVMTHVGLRIHDNYLTAPNISYSRGFHYNSGPGSHDNQMYNNIIFNTPTVNQIAGPGLMFYNNVIDSVTKPPQRGSNDRAGTGLVVYSYNNTPVYNVQIYNNTIVNCQNFGLNIEIGNTDKVSRVTIANNILSGNGWGHQELHDYQFRITDNVLADSITFKNNLLYKDTVTLMVFSGQASGEKSITVAALNAQNGLDGDTLINNIVANPMMISVSDYHLQQGSPAIDAGVNVGLPYFGAAPDIGRYESNYVPPPVQPNLGKMRLRGNFKIKLKQ